jgi:hypothetical protein
MEMKQNDLLDNILELKYNNYILLSCVATHFKNFIVAILKSQ